MVELTATTKFTQRIVLLDVLRLFAALLVLCFHWIFRGPATGDQATHILAANNIAMYGYIGVDWFFIISGFVIAWTAEGRTALQFALARFTRIYPAFVICMSLTFLATLYFQPQFTSAGILDWCANLIIFAPAIGSKLMDGAYWSIIIELIFYAWVFIFLLGGLFDKHRRALAIVWLTIALINQQLLHSGMLRIVAATEFAPWFIMGMMLHDMWKRSVGIVPLVILTVAFLASCMTLLDQLVGFAKDYGQSPSHAIVLIMNAVGLALVVACIQITPKRLTWERWAGFAGALSYPLYLLHQHLGYMLIDGLAPYYGAPLTLLLTFALVIGAAGLIAFFIEPRLRQKLTNGFSSMIQGSKMLAPVVDRPSRLR